LIWHYSYIIVNLLYTVVYVGSTIFWIKSEMILWIHFASFSSIPQKSLNTRVARNRVSKFHNNEFQCPRTSHCSAKSWKIDSNDTNWNQSRVFEKVGEAGYRIQPNNINTISDIGHLTPAYLSVKLTFTTVDKNGTGHMLIHSKQLISVPPILIPTTFMLFCSVSVYSCLQIKSIAH
jgi:hypothetical protein